MSESLKSQKKTTENGRRKFLKGAAAAAGSGLVLFNTPSKSFGQQRAKIENQVNVALVGCGAQGQAQIEAAKDIPGLRFVATCDIWRYNLKIGFGRLREYGHTTKPYMDYREMLANQDDIDAVFVATPDFWHAPVTNDSLKAGKHVYCEKMMSNTIEAAASMVKTQKETGKLLQIGHQRRSNPRYIQAKNELLDKHELLGRITAANAQWNRAVSEDLGWPKKESLQLSQEELEKWGYKNMQEFRNWRWYKKYGGGPISDLGAHQIDIFNWFLGTTPKSVMAGGGVDYYNHHEWYDNVMSIFEYDTPEGVARAFYTVLTTTSSGGGFFENFMGTEGSLKISELDKWGVVYREAHAPDWERYENLKLLRKQEIPKAPADELKVSDARKKKQDARVSAALAAYDITATLDDWVHQPHIENFIDAVRNGTPLNCPAEEGFKTCVTVLTVNEAVAAQKMLQYGDDAFKA